MQFFIIPPPFSFFFARRHPVCGERSWGPVGEYVPLCIVVTLLNQMLHGLQNPGGYGAHPVLLQLVPWFTEVFEVSGPENARILAFP
jgi:hypothetical protein